MNVIKRCLCAAAVGMVAATAIAMPVSAAGWQKNGNGWQYQYGEEGEHYRNCWQHIDGKWYRFNEEGQMRTGWIQDNNRWYYCDAEGAMRTGWFLDGGKWYCCGGDGAMKTGWFLDGGKWYCCDENGAMRTGWILEDDKWYYCDADGVMQTGWYEVGGKRYFSNRSGVMQTGLVQIDGVTCNFGSNGAFAGQNAPGYAQAAFTADGRPVEIVDPVKDGRTVRIVIPEGKSAGEIAEILEQNGVCRSDAFLKAINSYETTSSTFQEFRDNADLFYEYEGCFYPDTYEFYRYDDPENIIRKMLINFDQKMSEDLTAQMKKKGLTLVETITLASMIQQEAATPEDMAKVSAVFWNRLKNSGEYPKLQSNPTKEYVENELLPNRQLGNAAVDPSAYDTYQAKGLPAGPICNPGMDAIQAALNPDPVCHAYYFCTDRQGTFYFAETYAEHQKNIETAKQVNSQMQ